MRPIFVVILILSTLQVIGQRIRPEIKKLAQAIEQREVLEAEYVGYGGVTTKHYKRFEQLRDKATFDELLQLLQNKNSVIKGYASWALADNRYPKLVEIFAEFLKTGESVTTMHGCIVSKDELAFEFYHRVLYQPYVHSNLSIEDSLFFQTQIQQLDSVLLYSNKEHDLRYQALSNNNGNPANYERIRHLAFNKKDINAIQALAIYRKSEDIESFKKLKEESFVAIAEFPDERFWEFISSYNVEDISLGYLIAISAFKTQESAKVLSQLYTTLSTDDIALLAQAVTKNYCAYYQSIILEIWENHKTIDINATKQIINDIPKKSANAFVNGLLLGGKFNFCEYYYDYDFDFGSSEDILPLMLEHVQNYQRASLLTICETNIKTADFTTLSDFLKCAKSNGLRQVSDEIIARLSQKNQAYEIFHLSDTYLTLNSGENYQLASILKSNQEDWDRGNWSDSFKKLFKENDLNID